MSSVPARPGDDVCAGVSKDPAGGAAKQAVSASTGRWCGSWYLQLAAPHLHNPLPGNWLEDRQCCWEHARDGFPDEKSGDKQAGPSATKRFKDGEYSSHNLSAAQPVTPTTVGDRQPLRHVEAGPDLFASQA